MSTKLKGGLTSDMVYAIYGSVSEFGPDDGPTQLTPTAIKPKFEGRALYELFIGAGIRIYPISSDLDKIAGDRTYRSLSEVPEPVEVVITCLAKSQAAKVVEEAARAGVKHIFFQPRTNSTEAVNLCKEKGIECAKGCMLSHWPVRGLTRFVSPCYYMGLGATKLPAK
jgi:predicted CoA-binding protein